MSEVPRDRNPIDVDLGAAQDAVDVSPGDVVAGRYRVERLLGEGGMAVVLMATDLELDEVVALKFLRKGARSAPDLLARFAKEARAIAKLKSEHVVRVRDVGTHGAAPFLVMEHLDGTDLADLLAAQRSLSPRRAATLMVQACEAVAEAHARGIVHRDLKPENLFVLQRDDGWVSLKVLDFGISKAALTGVIGDVDLSSSHTTMMMGSPYYMSPEQLRSTRDVDAQADLWSLGAVLFEALSGEPAFPPGLEFTELIAAILESPHRRLRELAPHVPEGLEAIVDRCLEKDPARRFANAGELADALLPFAGTEAVLAADRARVFSRAQESRGAAGDRASISPGRASISPGRASISPGRASLEPLVVAHEASGRAHTGPSLVTFATPTAAAPRREVTSRKGPLLVAALSTVAVVLVLAVVVWRRPATQVAPLHAFEVEKSIGARPPLATGQPVAPEAPQPESPKTAPSAPAKEQRDARKGPRAPAAKDPAVRGAREGAAEVYEEDARPPVTPMPLDIRTSR